MDVRIGRAVEDLRRDDATANGHLGLLSASYRRVMRVFVGEKMPHRVYLVGALLVTLAIGAQAGLHHQAPPGPVAGLEVPLKLGCFYQTRVTPEPDRQAPAALQAAQHDVEGCFLEWAERTDAEQRPRGSDAALVVRFVITDGVGHSAQARGERSPSLTLCVESAFTRRHYPRGPFELDLVVDVMWSGDLQAVNLTGRVVGERDLSNEPLHTLREDLESGRQVAPLEFIDPPEHFHRLVNPHTR
jgi:hypothetical protein